MNSAQPATVGIIFVNWNGWRHTIAACRSLDQSTHQAIEIIIVDNASADDSLVQLRAALPKAHIIANPINSGFAGACNIGIRQAVQMGCEYIFLLNNDALAQEGTVAKLVQASKTKEDSALLGSVLVYIASGTYQFFGSRTGSVVRQPEFLTFEKDATLLSQDFIETDFIVGAAFFIPVRVLDRIGPFDESFFLNYEETDFCYRARDAGIPSFIVPASVVHHHANASMGHYPAPMYAYFLSRNGLMFTDRHGDPSQRRLLFRLKTVYWDIRRARRSARRKNLPTWAILWAFWDYSRGRSGDCPAAIRRLDAKYRGIPYQPSSAGRDAR